MLSKKQFRVEILKELNGIPPEQKKSWDEDLNQRLCLKLQELKPKQIHIYLPLNHEVDTWPSIEFAQGNNITVLIPKVTGKHSLSHHLFTNRNALAPSKFGIMEPSTPPINTLNLDLIICPGLAFDLNRNRLGYGGGFYDRFLLEQMQVPKIALCYPINFKNTVPTDKHDVKMDEILVAKRKFPL